MVVVVTVEVVVVFKICGLRTLSCDFVPHNYETLKWLSSLPTLMQSHSGGDSIAIGKKSPSPTPPYPFRP